jgi:VWFA-related protein
MSLVRAIFVLLVSAVLALPPLTLYAVERPEAPVFGTEVSLVLLPVFVVDRAGKAVRGLGRADFEVLEDGQRAELVSFRHVDTTDDDEQDELRQASAARRRFLLLFDKSFTDLAGLGRARRAAGAFVRTRLADSDLAAVATFDVNQGVRVVANFTEDRALLAHAIDTLGVPQISRISDPLGLAVSLLSTDLTARPGGGEDAQALLDNVSAVIVRQMRAAEAEQYRSHVQTLLAGFEELARGLRNVEGRKQVVYFSAGFDSRFLVGEQGYEQETTNLSLEQGRLWEVDGQARFGDARIRERIAEATQSLARADAVVHTIDVTGFGSDDSLSRLTPLQDGTRDTRGREGLSLLAAETGGRFFKDTNNLTPVLAEMLEMTSRYYVLGIQPRSAKGPGAFHKIKVKIARKGVKLSHRPGYFERVAVAAKTPLQRQFEAAQLVMTGVGDADLRFSSLCLPFPEPGERQTLGVVVQVPRESLRWKGGEPLSLELYGYAVAEDGTARDYVAQLARLDPALADPTGDALGVSFFGSLSVPAGRYTLRLMLHERESGASGIQFIDVVVPPYDPRVGFLLPPVLKEQGRWITLDMSKGREGGRPYPFEVGGKPFLPRADFAVEGEAAETLVLLAWEPRQRGDPAADIQLWSSLTNGDGVRVPAGPIEISSVLSDDDSGRRTYVLGYTPGRLPKGDYTLRIGVGEAGTLLQSYSLIRVRPRS